MYRPYTWSSVGIIERLIKRFDLQEYPIAPDKALILPTTVQPITNIDELLRQLKIETLYGPSDPNTPGAKVVHVIPSGKRQQFYIIGITTVAGTTNRYTQLQISDGTTSLIYEEFAATLTQNVKIDPTFFIPESFEIKVNVSVYNAGDTLRVQAIFLEEDAF